jgi:hypothetical protein
MDWIVAKSVLARPSSLLYEKTYLAKRLHV